MKPANEWTIADLEALAGQDETTSLEFKDARSLLNEDKKKDEIAKDVSAMANAAGGIIVYGIGENSRGVASGLAPIENRKGLTEWLEQVIANNIEPKVQGVLIHPIKLPDDKLTIVVEVPQAASLAPHQSTRHSQYFRRWNRTVQAMLDHEVRDLMRRASAPELFVKPLIVHDHANLFHLRIQYGNRSSEPALYSQIDLIFERAMEVQGSVGWTKSPIVIGPQGRQGRAFRKAFLVPNDMPIIVEQPEIAFLAEMTVPSGQRFEAYYIIAAPGFRTVGGWGLSKFGSDTEITIEELRPPFAIG